MSEACLVVVDDDSIDRYVVRRLLKRIRSDAEFLEFETGEDFLKMVGESGRLGAEADHASSRTLVLLDLNMPRLSGVEVLERLGELPNSDRLVVVIYTSSNHPQDRADTERFPFVSDYVVKPLTEEKLETLCALVE